MVGSCQTAKKNGHLLICEPDWSDWLVKENAFTGKFSSETFICGIAFDATGDICEILVLLSFNHFMSLNK